MQIMLRLAFLFTLSVGVFISNANADIDQECALPNLKPQETKTQVICQNGQDRQAAISLNKLMLYSLAQPKSQEEFEFAVKWKNSWRGIAHQCLQFKNHTEYGHCMTVNMQRFTGILTSQYPNADLQADSEKLRIQALDKIKLLVAESKKRSDECIAEVIRKSDDRAAPPIEAGRLAFTNCRSKIHSYMRLASDTYVIDDLLVPIAMTTDESLASTEEHIYNNDMLSQLVMDIRAKPANAKSKAKTVKKKL